ncbi:hypothetical protein MPTK1_4g11730 [Marchantia polymorpha subsp. ruderalis]
MSHLILSSVSKPQGSHALVKPQIKRNRNIKYRPCLEMFLWYCLSSLLLSANIVELGWEGVEERCQYIDLIDRNTLQFGLKSCRVYLCSSILKSEYN